MNLITAINWIGVFALSIGSLISGLTGNLLLAALGFLLVALLATTLLPTKGKYRLNLLHRLPRLEIAQLSARLCGVIGCWVLAGVGGWEYVPGAVVLTAAMAGAVGTKVLEKRRERGRQVQMIEPETTMNRPDHLIMDMNVKTNPAIDHKNMMNMLPPQYTCEEEREKGVARIQTPGVNLIVK